MSGHVRPGWPYGTNRYYSHSRKVLCDPWWCMVRQRWRLIADWETLLRTNRIIIIITGRGGKATTQAWMIFLFSILVCDVLPLIINNPDVRLPASLLYKYLNKAAEFYINYVTRSTQTESQYQGKNIFTKLVFPKYILALLKLGLCNESLRERSIVVFYAH